MSPALAPASAAPPCRVIVADDHPVVRAGIVSMLQGRAGVQVVGEAADGLAAVGLWQQLRPDIALIDLQMPRLDGFEVLAAIRAQQAEAALVVMTAMAGDEDVYRAVQAGARGFLLKDCGRSELHACLDTVADGRCYLQAQAAARLAERITREPLTGREMDVLRSVALGLSNKLIARRLGMAEGTVKTHLKSLFEKLQVTTRTQAVRAAVARGLVREVVEPA